MHRGAVSCLSHQTLSCPIPRLQEPCNIKSINASTCMHGFSLQGNFEAARRNYTRLWQQVEAAMAAGSVPTEPPVRPFHLHLVGRGNVSSLRMPDPVREHATVHFNLRFPEYYDQVRVTSSVQWCACLTLWAVLVLI